MKMFTAICPTSKIDLEPSFIAAEDEATAAEIYAEGMLTRRIFGGRDILLESGVVVTELVMPEGPGLFHPCARAHFQGQVLACLRDLTPEPKMA